jgi:hypothetical protein
MLSLSANVAGFAVDSFTHLSAKSVVTYEVASFSAKATKPRSELSALIS